MVGSRRSSGKRMSIENGSLSAKTPPNLARLELWKRASIAVKGRPDWLFIKLQCHGMDPRDKEVMIGETMQRFLQELVEGTSSRLETFHFVTAREMVNIMLAACDGREGNPGDYRDYRLKRFRAANRRQGLIDTAQMVVNG